MMLTMPPRHAKTKVEGYTRADGTEVSGYERGGGSSSGGDSGGSEKPKYPAPPPMPAAKPLVLTPQQEARFARNRERDERALARLRERQGGGGAGAGGGDKPPKYPAPPPIPAAEPLVLTPQQEAQFARNRERDERALARLRARNG